MSSVSRNAVRRAGSTIRAYTRGEATEDQREAAIDVVMRYRSQFAAPLVAVNNGLRKFAGSANAPCEVTQRLKKLDTIIDKVSVREGETDLSRLQDIGGCRAVFNDIDALWRMNAKIMDSWDSHVWRISDYTDDPRPSGYRALHIVVRREPGRLPIEIQLRTKAMHLWAETVEAFSKLMQTNYKTEGDTVIHEFMRLSAEADRCREFDRDMDPEVTRAIHRISPRVYSFVEQHLPGAAEGNR